MFLKISFLLLLAIPIVCFSQKRMTKEEYIKNYGELAVKEMKRSGVPASITLAQGLLESDEGNSDLAKTANNHFGVKCHKAWEGEKVYKNDDDTNECFRKYRSVWHSYNDHSDFLRGGKRYAFLFELDPTDYKAWAEGLNSTVFQLQWTADQNQH